MDPADPSGSTKWAHEHQFIGTDRFHGEAAIDMSDHGFRYEPDPANPGKTRPVGVVVEPRVEAVKNGRDVLIDPEGLGKTYQTKVAESSSAGPRDGYVQARKAADTLQTSAADTRRRTTTSAPSAPRSKPAWTSSAKSPTDTSNPNKVTPFANAGHGNLTTFMEKISSQYASLKWAKR